MAAWKPLSPSLTGGAAVVSYAQKPLNIYTKAARVRSDLLEKRPSTANELTDKVLWALIERTLEQELQLRLGLP